MTGARGASRLAAAALSALSLAALGCGGGLKHALVDTAMVFAYRPPPPSSVYRGEGYQLLAGDMHCHVRPPDPEWHVVRELDETIELAASEGLDFVVLTPHVGARFFLGEQARAAVLEQQASVRRGLAERDLHGIVFVPGFEYTDFDYGHVGMAFGDLGQVLADVPIAEAQQNPGRFFERYVERGGVLTINHPFLTGLDSSLREAAADMSFRAFTSPGSASPELEAAARLAQTVEAFNMAAAYLRDRFLVGDDEDTTRRTLADLDARLARGGRRLTPVGGTDSHSHHLRAVTYVLANEKSEKGVREALLAGRVCVRSPEACSLQVAGADGHFLPVGSAFEGVRELHVRAFGSPILIEKDGAVVAKPREGEEVIVPVASGRCSTVRARVGEGYSGPVYANCAVGPAVTTSRGVSER